MSFRSFDSMHPSSTISQFPVVDSALQKKKPPPIAQRNPDKEAQKRKCHHLDLGLHQTAFGGQQHCYGYEQAPRHRAAVVSLLHFAD